MTDTNIILAILAAAWGLLRESAPFVIFGIIVGGLLRMFISPGAVAAQLGQGRFRPVLKAALWGIPLPLCSCGVLPAAASLKRQGAGRGALTAFLISTPESGVDSIATTYALLDPVMTVARPLSAFLTAAVAGVAQAVFGVPETAQTIKPDLSCPVDGCCDGQDCDPATHAHHHGLGERVRAGLVYAFGELWGDLAGWFFVGLLLAGVIAALVPDDVMLRYFGGGLTSMLFMLLVGIPMYICATASTPVAAALILKGVSPGAALVFLLAGPATNLTSLAVLRDMLGGRGTLIYLVSLCVMTVLCGLGLDAAYGLLGIRAGAVVGQAAEIIPAWLEWGSALLLVGISVRPLWRSVSRLWRKDVPACGCGDCGCGSGHEHATEVKAAPLPVDLKPMSEVRAAAAKGEAPSCSCKDCH